MWVHYANIGGPLGLILTALNGALKSYKKINNIEAAFSYT